MADARAIIASDALSVDAAIARVQHVGAGAVVVMLGCVRDHTHKDGATVAVSALEYEAYAGMAASVIDAIAAEAESRWPGVRAFVAHRVGALALGDLAVVVATSAPHRAEAFASCAFVIDKLKEDAPIWKREHGADGVSWVGLRP
ncbi:MAG TPA: molybdenum cofactor biosynthesis protein MoaE [Myxococcota bacterium]